jgi:hypothetical protein
MKISDCLRSATATTFGHSDKDERIFALIVTDSAGDFQILDISDSIDQSYSFFDIKTCWL